jgi:WD40 repeat protein
MYRMLTGSLPFQGNARMLLHQVLHEEARLPRRLDRRIPRDLETICLKAMAKEPDRRYQTARQLADDLRRFLNGEPIKARPVGSVERLRRWCARNRVVAGLLALVFLSLTGGAGAVTYFALRSREKISETRYDHSAEYAQKLTAAERAWRDGQLQQAQKQLQECPEEYRHWEWYLLRRMYQGTPRILPAHASAVSALAYSPDGRWIASGGMGRSTTKPESPVVRLAPEVKLWNSTTDKEAVLLQGVQHNVRALAFPPDRERLIGVSTLAEGTASFAVLETWNIRTGELLRTVKIEMGRTFPAVINGRIEAVRPSITALSADGSRLATAFERLGAFKRVLNGQMLAASTLCFMASPFGQGPVLTACPHVLAMSQAYEVQIWDTETGGERLRLMETSAFVRSLVFSPSGQELAVAGSDTMRSDSEQAIQDAITATPLGQIQRTVRQVGGQQAMHHFLTLWGTDRGEKKASFTALPQPVSWVALSPDGRRLAVAWNEARSPTNKIYGVVKVYDIPSRQEAYSIKLATGSISGGVVFSPDGHYLACGDPAAGRNPIKAAGVVNVWEAQTGEEVTTLRGHSGPVQLIAFSPDSRQLVSGATDRTLRIWDSANEPGLLNLKGQAVVLVPGGKDVATLGSALDPGQQKPVLVLTLWDSAAGQPRYVCKSAIPGAVAHMTCSADGQRLIAVFTSQDEKQKRFHALVKVWGVAMGQEEATFPLEGVSWNKLTEYGTGLNIPLTSSRDGRLLAVVGDAPEGQDPAKRTVAVWDLVARRPLFTCPLIISEVFGLAFSPDGQRLALGEGQSWRVPLDAVSSQPPTGHVKLLDARTGQELFTFQAQSVGINALEFSPDGKQLVTAGRDGEIKVWDGATGETVRSFQDPSELIWSLAFSPDGRRLATGSKDHSIKLWDPHEGRLVFSLRGHATGVSHLSFGEDGHQLASVGVSGTIKVWDAGTPR